ncbi:MAG: ATP synthase F1 subunit delta [Bacteroidales bacterium]|nr:ATP synthase F1 subunit delta [Bacteroidales bacterium]
MNSGAITKRYAIALLMYTKDNGSGARVCAQVVKILHRPYSIPDRLEPELQQFIMLLYKNGRMEYLRRILRTFVDMYCEDASMAHVRLTTVVESPELERRVAENIEARSGMKVLLETELDPSLIGGYRVEYDGYMLDASVKRQLEILQRQFVEKNNRIV